MKEHERLEGVLADRGAPWSEEGVFGEIGDDIHQGILEEWVIEPDGGGDTERCTRSVTASIDAIRRERVIRSHRFVEGFGKFRSSIEVETVSRRQGR